MWLFLLCKKENCKKKGVTEKICSLNGRSEEKGKLGEKVGRVWGLRGEPAGWGDLEEGAIIINDNLGAARSSRIILSSANFLERERERARAAH